VQSNKILLVSTFLAIEVWLLPHQSNFDATLNLAVVTCGKWRPGVNFTNLMVKNANSPVVIIRSVSPTKIRSTLTLYAVRQ
jgi:hypothetical protein